MELVLNTENQSGRGMQYINDTMKRIFKDTVVLENYWGPVQMCVFNLEYHYLPKNYIITFECERGVLVVEAKDPEGRRFSPGMIYPEANYYHYEDVDRDIDQLVSLTYKAIRNQEATFLTDDEYISLRQKK